MPREHFRSIETISFSAQGAFQATWIVEQIFHCSNSPYGLRDCQHSCRGARPGSISFVLPYGVENLGGFKYSRSVHITKAVSEAFVTPFLRGVHAAANLWEVVAMES